MRVKHAPGRQVRDPISKRHIPEQGKDVPENSYWLRRLRTGDVLHVTADVSTPAPAALATKDEE